MQSYTAMPDRLFLYKRFLTDGGQVLPLRDWRPAGKGYIVRFHDVESRTAAETICAKDLFVERADLPPLDNANGEYYHNDLIGLLVVDTDGQALGHVLACPNYGAGDILELDTGILLPFTAAVVQSIDFTAGRIQVAPPAMV